MNQFGSTMQFRDRRKAFWCISKSSLQYLSLRVVVLQNDIYKLFRLLLASLRTLHTAQLQDYG